MPVFCGKDVAVNQTIAQQSLLEYVLDLILMTPVDWMAAQEHIRLVIDTLEKVPTDSVDILNFGPGYGVSKSATRGRDFINVLDVSTTDTTSTKPKDPADSYSDGDIAIVGMAVDLPGAPDAKGLWKALAEEVNSVSEVRCSRHTSAACAIAKPDRYPILASTLKILRARK